ncbi:excinuclease ATPase subunit [Rheinheimera sp. UJ51]|uniref:excinuclease ATPase subunit n=1 Tax=unclassified Rheinheimera TaxID=115860 RepID=UPI001E55A017|nr:MULTISPECIES: excinuclease ATPase subunit [unclassified Rheinheimera]MCC5452166.1 excinuclease ATPase subunit [Rheinheimera sp. UJ51]MCF4010723.1 excinuclease ATPase subunit [Rheinheimera sp. UJ63]
MQIQSAYAAGMQGLQRASAGITEETVNINRQTQQNRIQEQDVAAQNNREATAATTPEPVQDTTQSIVKMEQQQVAAQANVRSLRTADEMLGSIIDIRV